METLIDRSLVFDLSYVDGIDKNVVYPPTAPVPLGPERIDRTLYLTQTPKLLIKIKDDLYV